MKPTEYIKEEHVTDGDRYRWDLLQRMESDGWQLINEPQNRMDATLAVLELLDNIPEKNRGGHLGSHAGEIVSLVLAKFGIEEFSADDHEWSKQRYPEQ